MGCACSGASKSKTVYTVTFSDSSTFETDSRPLALAKARISGGTVTSKVVPK